MSALYDGIRYWLPLVTFGTITVRAFLHAKTGVEKWAGKLLDNHLAHIELNTQETVKVLKEIRDAGNPYRPLASGLSNEQGGN